MTVRWSFRTAAGASIGIRVAIAWILLAGIGWDLLHLSDQLPGEGAARLHLAVVWLGIAAVLILGVSLLVTQHTSDRLSDHLAELEAHVSTLGEGAFGRRVGTDGPTEVARLAEAINRAADNLAQREQRLQNAERLAAAGAVVTGVAHEINNPLTFLRLNHEALLRRARNRLASAPPEEQAALGSDIRLLERNLVGLGRLAEISRMLLTMGRSRQELQAHDLGALAQGAFLMARYRFMDRVQVRFEGRAPPATCNAGEVSQVFLNLFLNAADALGESGNLRVELEDQGEVVAVAFEDDGPGVPPALRHRLFEPFMTTKRSGTGLGLSTARELLARQGGSILHEAPASGGARFVVRLPRAAPAGANP